MKKNNLLSKAEMKKVMGGYRLLSACTYDTQCTGGQWCCPNFDDPSQPWTCETPVLTVMPGSDETPLLCPQQ